MTAVPTPFNVRPSIATTTGPLHTPVKLMVRFVSVTSATASASDFLLQSMDAVFSADTPSPVLTKTHHERSHIVRCRIGSLCRKGSWRPMLYLAAPDGSHFSRAGALHFLTREVEC